jgi:membrane peptidoglycan carboxypeptidase
MDQVLHAGASLRIPGEASSTTQAATSRPTRYRVRAGDTLSSIAGQFRVSIRELQRWNGLSSSRVLAGQLLTVHPAGTEARAVETVRAPAKAPRPVRTRVPVYANSTEGDVAEYDDPLVREAAVHALGRYNGSVVAIDPNTGRILTVVNQKLAFASGFIPCSTIKPVIALAALEESVITRDTMIKVAPRRYLNLVEAMARSNNEFFEELGRRLGFETVSKYARLLGLGELTGYGIPEEQPGTFPLEPPARGGVARMSSFGEGIQMTPLQMASLISTLANGGTMYYLQYPRTMEERDNFTPRVKRKLDIAALVPDIRDGLLAAVLYGTGKLSYVSEHEQTLGKTGTCSDSASQIGWFVSYADQESPKIVVAVLMRGRGAAVKGAIAAGIAGRMYKRLYAGDYFAGSRSPVEGPEPDDSPLPDTGTVSESGGG